MNKITIDGEIKYWKLRSFEKNGETKNFVTFSLNNTEANGRWKKYCNINCTIFGDLVNDVYSKITDGDKVYIEGTLTDNNYTDASGEKKYNKQINVTKMELVKASDEVIEDDSSKDSENKNTTFEPSEYEKKQVTDGIDIDSDDLPF
jgi:single-stranded DNA-binding protein